MNGKLALTEANSRIFNLSKCCLIYWSKRMQDLLAWLFFSFFFPLESNTLLLWQQDGLYQHPRQSIQCIKYKTTTVYTNFFNCVAHKISNMNWKKENYLLWFFFHAIGKQYLLCQCRDSQDNIRSL